MKVLAGLPTARGWVSGPAFLHAGEDSPDIPDDGIVPGGEDAELERLARARLQTRRELEELAVRLRTHADSGEVKVFESHLQILEDPLLMEGTAHYIRKEHCNAAKAVHRTANEARARFSRMSDAFFRERVKDLDDVERRLLAVLLGKKAPSPTDLMVPSVIVADDLTPSEFVRLPRDLVLGFAMNGGSATSHVALLARALDIPAVTGLGDATSHVKTGDRVLLDGTKGELTVNPDEAAQAAFRMLEGRRREPSAAVSHDVAAGTLADGGAVPLYANAQPGLPLAEIRSSGACGIGLYRSEYLWLGRAEEPTEEEQFVAYREAAASASGLARDGSVTIRTFDVGGDKIASGAAARESNPFLGNRSIRYLLSRPDVFRRQLRAILRASAFGRVKIMHPMVSCVEELVEAAAILEDVKRELTGENVPFDPAVPVGAMIEVPAAAINAEALVRHVSFFSIGTNDLIQYAMAADRGNEAVSRLYQPTHPAVLWLVRHVVDVAHQAGLRVSVCGESAAEPVVGLLWAAMGVDALSMVPGRIPAMGTLLHRLTRRDLLAYADHVCSLGARGTASEIYERAHAWLRAKMPDFDGRQP